MISYTFLIPAFMALLGMSHEPVYVIGFSCLTLLLGSVAFQTRSALASPIPAAVSIPEADFTTDGNWGFAPDFPTSLYTTGQTVTTTFTDPYYNPVTMTLVVGNTQFTTAVTPTGLPLRTNSYVIEEAMVYSTPPPGAAK